MNNRLLRGNGFVSEPSNATIIFVANWISASLIMASPSGIPTLLSLALWFPRQFSSPWTLFDILRRRSISIESYSDHLNQMAHPLRKVESPIESIASINGSSLSHIFWCKSVMTVSMSLYSTSDLSIPRQIPLRGVRVFRWTGLIVGLNQSPFKGLCPPFATDTKAGAQGSAFPKRSSLPAAKACQEMGNLHERSESFKGTLATAHVGPTLSDL
jgi:hypothetical protein